MTQRIGNEKFWIFWDQYKKKNEVKQMNFNNANELDTGFVANLFQKQIMALSKKVAAE